MSKIQWHPAFCSAMQLELIDYRGVLEFRDEYQLTKGPLRVDLLIIKKRQNVIIDKNIARSFQLHNLIEYKSPDDTFDINDLNKIISHKFYYAYREKVKTKNISVTVVISQHPYNLLKDLSGDYKITSDQKGIYVIDNDMRPIQIVVLSELPEEQNLWLTNLNKELAGARLQPFLTGIEEHSKKHGNDIVLDSYLDVVTQANIETFKEPAVGENIVQYLKDLGYLDKWQAEGEARGEARGRAETVIRILSHRLGLPSKPLQKKIGSIQNIAKLNELADFALTCVSLDEFATALE